MADQKPQFMLLAGPSGSGKTTFLDNNRHMFPDNIVTPDAFLDRFADLPQKQARHNAVELANTQQADLIANRQSFVQETLLTGDSKINLLRDMQERGYETTLVYMCLNDPQDNEDRVRNRIEAGGNFVPPEIVKKDYQLSLQHLPKAILVADSTLIYDNSSQGQRHSHVATIEQGVVIEQAPELPQWVEKTFPSGLQAHLDGGSRARDEPQIAIPRRKAVELDR